jgi:hypothetical protein
MRNLHKEEKHTNNTQIFGLIAGVLQIVAGTLSLITYCVPKGQLWCIVLSCWVYTS